MTYKLWTRYEPLMVEVIVETYSPQSIALKVSDVSQANTVFMDRTKTINGRESLFVRMPLSPNTIAISVFNEKIGNNQNVQDSTFRIVDIKKRELQITLGKTKMDTSIVRNFVAFAQKFAFNCGVLAAGKSYHSGAGNFRIEYLPYIQNSRNGQKMATPARISTKNGRIQVSQEQFLNFTIPMRMAILLHEFSHFYINSDVENETEADLNALTIYLGLGYSIQEGYAAFNLTFQGYPTDENKRRYDIIDKFIKDYIAEYKLTDVYAPVVNKRV